MAKPFAIIREDGSCDAQYLPIISDTELRNLIELVFFNRIFDHRMVLLQRQGRLGFFMTSTGEESSIIGSAFCLRKDDPIFLSYRELGALFQRGVPTLKILAQLYGSGYDTSKGRQLPVHYTYRDYYIPSISSPVANQLPQVCGYAYASKFKKQDTVALAYIGEGSTSEGDFHVALNFSGVFKVPAIYMIRNNGYAISTPGDAQTAATDLSARGVGYGIPGVQVNGNDILAVIKIVQEAVTRARAGEGPTLIESFAYRLGAHSTSDDPSGYRSKEEEHTWAKEDNLKLLQKHGEWRGIWSEKIAKEKLRQYEDEITDMIKKAESEPKPPIESIFDDVYEGVPPHLEKQKTEYFDYLKQSGLFESGDPHDQ